MDKYQNRIWDTLFTKCSEEEVKFVQVQIDCFKNYDTPIYNMKMLQFQLKFALVMNIYLSYLLIIERDNILDYFYQSYIGTLWFTIICLQNIIIVLPKIVMMVMLSHVINNSKNIDQLIVNVEQFMKTKIYYYNCYISKFIWINYGIGALFWFYSKFFGSYEEDDKIIPLCHYVLYLMIARLFLFIVKIFYQSKGLTKNEFERLVQTKEFIVDDIFCKKHEDCCSVCLDEYQVGDVALGLDCKHYYHLKCIQPWLSQQNKCPCCNQFAFKEL